MTTRLSEKEIESYLEREELDRADELRQPKFKDREDILNEQGLESYDIWRDEQLENDD
jgi:hypothetical protein